MNHSQDVGADDDVQPLVDLVVADLSHGLAGAYCARLLAAGGAEVTVAEPPGGSALRRWTLRGELPAGQTGALFQYLRSGQHSVVADGDVSDLLRRAAVIITDDGSASILASEFPDCIVVSITGYGLTGPWAGQRINDFLAQADAGAVALRGVTQRPPIQMGLRVIEWVTGAYAAVAALGAWTGKLTTGAGELIDLSMCEVANLTGTVFQSLHHSLAGAPPIPAGQPVRSMELPSIEPTADGWVGFNTNTRDQLDAFLILIEQPELIADGAWAFLGKRLARAAEWNAMVRAWTTQHTTGEIVEQASLLRIPVAPVNDGRSVQQLDHVIARGSFVEHPGGFSVPRRPWLIDGAAPPPPRRAPALGQRSRPASATGSSPRPSTVVTPQATPCRPLQGLRVLDATSWWAGPAAGGVLAALGAEVIHVESIQRPDGMRTTGGAFAATRDQWWELSAFFLAANTNKQGITLDLGSPAGRELFLRLVECSDVLIENFTPRVLEQFDLGWRSIQAANPRCVMVRMPAFGLDGPWRDRPGFAQTMDQASGLAWMTGHGDDQPRIQRGPCDPNGGLHAAFAALVALHRRARLGTGCLVESAMFESALAIAAEISIEWSAYGHLAGRDGNRGPQVAPQGLYESAEPERWVAVACLTDDDWSALHDVLGLRVDDLPGGADGPAGDVAGVDGRRRHHDLIDGLIASWISERSVSEALETLAAAGVPAVEVRDARMATTHPQFVDRRYFELVDHPVAGRHLTPGLPWRSRHRERWIEMPAPTLGQHNRDVLGSLLGLSDAEVGALEASGVLGSRPRLA